MKNSLYAVILCVAAIFVSVKAPGTRPKTYLDVKEMFTNPDWKWPMPLSNVELYWLENVLTAMAYSLGIKTDGYGVFLDADFTKANYDKLTAYHRKDKTENGPIPMFPETMDAVPVPETKDPTMAVLLVNFKSAAGAKGWQIMVVPVGDEIAAKDAGLAKVALLPIRETVIGKAKNLGSERIVRYTPIDLKPFKASITPPITPPITAPITAKKSTLGRVQSFFGWKKKKEEGTAPAHIGYYDEYLDGYYDNYDMWDYEGDDDEYYEYDGGEYEEMLSRLLRRNKKYKN